MKMLLVVFLAASFLSCTTQPPMKHGDSRPISPGGAAIASLVPGLPQALNGEPIKGLAVAAVTIPALLVFSGSMDNNGDPAAGKELQFYLSLPIGLGGFAYSLGDGVIAASRRTAQWRQLYPIQIGVTSMLVEKSIGRPSKINRTRVSGIVHEQWVYYPKSGKGETKYYYFENGILTGIQD